MTLPEAQDFLDSLAHFGMRFGLERMHRLLEALGHPERRFRVLHVAGTNGKGSTCAFAASMLRAHGLRVGLYTSPHLVRFNERIQVDGQDIGDEQLAEGVEALLAAFPQARDPADPLTFFEFGTALALWHFAGQGVQVAVLETGLGGRLDATNAVQSEVTAITRISLDHTAVLGPTLEAIAAEKAGIFKSGARVVLARQPAEALPVLVRAAETVGQPPLVAGRDFQLAGAPGAFAFFGGGRTLDHLSLALAGPHQRENAETAIQAALLLEPTLGEETVRQGLAQTVWPGRFEVVDRAPLTILDGAHNPDGARTLAESLQALYPGVFVHLVFGVLGDKDVSGVAARLMPLAGRLYLACPKNERALPLERLQALAAPYSARHEVFGSVAEALLAARAACRPGELVLVAGSLYVVGEAKALWACPGKLP